jgi:hypothetical protein
LLPATVGGGVPALSPSTGAASAPSTTLYGLQLVACPALTPGTAWVLDGSRSLAVQRIPAEIAVSDQSEFDRDGIAVRARLRMEFASIYPATVCRISAT